ncbi:MAG: alanine racemase [Microbacterium sp.]|jgi:D-serine deaminase-like pyridoxal phosphate-dependent protein|nr:alanine racemase [Microbacterium sp.]
MTVPDPVLGPWAKAFPPRLWGSALSDVHTARARLNEFITPVLVLGTEALGHNERTVSGWARDAGVLLAPHGKTTMSPALWQRLLAEGAWGITLATPWQVELAVSVGVQRILLANDLTDIAAATRFSEHAARGVRIVVWADSPATVARLARHTGPVPLEVMVDVGGADGRTGARGFDAAVAVAEAIAAEPNLAFAGVAGYEGPFGATREDVAEVDVFLRELLAVHERVAHLVPGRPILSAGGSEWPDRVAAILGGRSDADVIVRSGAYQVHDDGLYRRESPFGTDVGAERLHSAMHVFSRVVSQPEPGLALLDAGRRDVSFDIDLPEVQLVVGRGPIDARITGLNDQHAFLRTDGEVPAVGEVVRLGLSHPCTALDKWRVIPLVDDPDADDPLVIGAVATCF